MRAEPAAVQRPRVGGVAEVGPGVHWIRMPLPYALDHVNLWLLEDGDGFTLVDTGHGDAATREGWESLVAAALGGRRVRRVLATHHHPDHLGLAGWMAERWGAEFLCTRAEWAEARALTLRTLGEAEGLAKEFYQRAGVPATVLRPLLDCSRSYPDNVTPLPGFREIADGDELTVGGRSWRVVVGRGHSPEHACLHAPDARLFISGDQVLPHITPNVSVWPRNPDDDPLAGFLASAEALRSLPGDTTVLPAHGTPFLGLQQRCRELSEHHGMRLGAALGALDRTRTAFEVMALLFDRSLDAHQTTFALGEAIAHLNRLVSLGRVERERRQRGPDRYARVAAGARQRGEDPPR